MGGTRKNKRSTRAAGTLRQLGAVLCKTTTWNYHICGFTDNTRKEQFIYTFIYFNGASYNPALVKSQMTS